MNAKREVEELISHPKLKSSNTYIFAPSWRKPLKYLIKQNAQIEISKVIRHQVVENKNLKIFRIHLRHINVLMMYNY